MINAANHQSSPKSALNFTLELTSVPTLFIQVYKVPVEKVEVFFAPLSLQNDSILFDI